MLTTLARLMQVGPTADSREGVCMGRSCAWQACHCELLASEWLHVHV